MKIGIISDTHIKKNTEIIKLLLDKYFSDVDLVIHAGDYSSIEVIDVIRQQKKFIGVWGNVDTDVVKHILNEREIIQIENFKIGVFHGHGQNKTPMERAYDKFDGDNADIIIFGHNHQPTMQRMNKTLMLNPGSLSRKRREPFYSYIILNIENGELDVQLKLVKDIKS